MKGPVVCIGSSLVDETFYCYDPPIRGTSNPSRLERSPGGVCRNIAHHLSLLGHPVELITIFGKDSDGEWLQAQCQQAGIGLKSAEIMHGVTGKFTAVLGPDGELFVGVVVNELEAMLNTQLLEKHKVRLLSASLVVADTNLEAASLQWLITFCAKNKIPFIVEPVSVPKAGKLSNLDLDKLYLITPNEAELASIQTTAAEPGTNGMIKALLKRGVRQVWLREGDNGSTLFLDDQSMKLAAPVARVIDTTGAGDAALAGWAHGYLKEMSPLECIAYGHALAGLVLARKGAICYDLNPQLLRETKESQYPHVVSHNA